MKKLIISCIVIFFMSNAFSQGIKFEHGTFEEALAKAKAENKMVFMDCYTVWCGPCKMLAKEIFIQKEVGDFFNANFVCLKMDMEKGEGVELAQQYEVKAFPTLLWLNGNGEIQHRTIGGTDAKGLIEIGNTAMDADNNWITLDKKYKSGKRSAEFLQNYIVVAMKTGCDYKEAMEIYLSKKEKKDMLNAKDFAIIKKRVRSLEGDNFKFVIENKDAYKAVAGEDEVNSLIERVMSVTLQDEFAKGDTTQIKTLKKKLIEIDAWVGNKVVGYMDLMLLMQSSDKPRFFSALVDYDLSYNMNNANLLHRHVSKIINSGIEPGQEILSKALRMIQRSVELEANCANTDTYAYVLLKTGAKEKAKEYAEKALGLASDEQKSELWSLQYLNK